MSVEPGFDAPPGALSGLIVADFSRVLAGPYCTMLLADLGAEVIKIESPFGDDTRSWVPPLRGDTGTYYLAINRNKKSVVLDLKNENDVELAKRLTERADVTIQNFKPGGLTKFGLDYESVRNRRADTIYCSISAFGACEGASLPGYDLLVQAMSGLMSLTGSADGPPYRSGISVFDVMTGLQAAIGILAALRHRDATGEGQHVETNLLSTALSGLVNQTSAYVAGGVVPHRMGNAHLSLFPYESLPTADGEIVVIAGNDLQFGRLAEALGLHDVVADTRFSTVGARNENRDLLRPLLTNRLARRSSREWIPVLRAAGVPCGPINDIQAGVELAEQLGLRPVLSVGGVPTVRNPLDLSQTPARYHLAPPRLDEHGDLIRRWLRDESAPAVPPAAGEPGLAAALSASPSTGS